MSLGRITVSSRSAGPVASTPKMKTLLTAMALACFLHVVMNSRLVSQESVISDPDDADEKAFDEKELEKALHEILYQDDDQDLQERAGNPNGDATQQCMLALPNVTSVIGYVNKQHPCVAFCKYRYTSASHGRVKQAYGGMYIMLNNLVSCGGQNQEYVCAGKKCVLPSADPQANMTCQMLLPMPTGTVVPFIAGPCKLLCADTGVFNIHNKSATMSTTLEDGTSCQYHGQTGSCMNGHCMLMLN